MTVLCPNGHASATTDYCDQCGTPIGIAPAAGPPQASAVLPVVEEVDTSPAVRQEPCPACGAGRSGDDRFCEGCGHDFLAPPRAPTVWEAVVSADRAQFERCAATGLSFPTDYVERRFALDARAVRIGRSRGPSAGGEEPPEIDLAGPYADPGISRLHAILERQNDGTYALRDLGSTLNDDPAPVGVDAAMPLAGGDRIRMGAWTTIIVRAR